MLRFGAALGVVALVAQVQFGIRAMGWAQIGELDVDRLLRTNVAGQFDALLFAEYLVPDSHDYFYEPMEPYFLIHWIPRVVWPTKPIPESWSYYNASYTQGRSLNVTPSIIGQFYINWGLPGVIWAGVWLGLLTRFADQLSAQIHPATQQALMAALGSFYAFIFASFRFYSPVYFTYTGCAFVAMLFLTTSIPAKTQDVRAKPEEPSKGARQ